MNDSPRPRLSLGQILNMSAGFLGIQFGFGLQLANMSAIYSKLGANHDEIPILWLAGPMTGLIVQPIIGSLSDRTWTRLGRRRPYFTIGAILSSLALFFMPDVPALWAAATMLWILDASINISMEPFRAFVADKLPPEQRTLGFVVQSFFIGVGAAVAGYLPKIFSSLGVTGNAANGVPLTVQYAFKLGAVVFLLAVMWTVLTSKEYPPENMEEFERKKREEKTFHFNPALIGGTALFAAIVGGARSAILGHFEITHSLIGGAIGAAIGVVLSGPEISVAVREMPRTMKQLAVVQFFTWSGLFCMWMFFGLATAQQIYGTLDPKSADFDAAGVFTGQAMAWMNIVCFIVAFLIPPLAARTSRKTVHALALGIGALGLLATGFIKGQSGSGAWQATQMCMGVAWASILSMPYAILSGALPAGRVGVYMGIFNFFIVIPEILLALTLQPVIKKLFNNDPVKVVMLGGACLIVAAIAVRFVQDDAPQEKLG